MNQSMTIELLRDARATVFTARRRRQPLACASALALADAGKRVLLVSTDPASNLQHVFETEIGERAPTPVPGADNLFALNIDPESAAQAYRDRVVGPVRGVLPEATVRSMEEQLSGACTTEIAAFDEFTLLLTDPAHGGLRSCGFATAPTGHTLRLLSRRTLERLPRYHTSGTRVRPLAGLEKQRSRQGRLDALATAPPPRLVLVSVRNTPPWRAARTCRTAGSASATEAGVNG